MRPATALAPLTERRIASSERLALLEQPQMVSGSILMAPHGHSWAQIPHPC